MKYINCQKTSNTFKEIAPKKYYLSGSLEYMASLALDASLLDVTHKSDTIKYYQIIFDTATTLTDVKSTLRDFIEDNHDIHSQNKIEMVYLLQENDTSNFLNNSIYNFEKGDNTPLADEMSLVIDNASFAEMVGTLSTFSELKYIYRGNHTSQYDWNIYYSNKEYTLPQLAEELDFKITLEQIETTQYHLSKK